MKRGATFFALVVALAVLLAARVAGAAVTVGSKAFTEGVVLGELVTRVCASGGAAVAHQKQLGGSTILFRALETGAVDAYVEYTGTLEHELLHTSGDAAIAQELSRRGIAVAASLGFGNTYALAVRESFATERALSRTSDLAAIPSLAYGLSHEIVARADGWPGLRDAYRLAPRELRPMDHDLAYRALAEAAIDVTDVYTTDAEIPSLRLRVLRDDRGYFPAYRAIVLVRADLAARAPGCARALARLEGAIDEATMQRLNAAVKIERRGEDEVAARFAREHLGIDSAVVASSLTTRLVERTGQHLVLTLVAVVFAVAVGLPLGIVCANSPRLRALVLGAAGVVQTVPSLALLVLFLPLFGIGTAPAVAALVLYSLFPVIEGTVTGLRTIDPALVTSADALGLPPRRRLLDVDLPLAAPSILSGIRTSAVLAVGTATLGAMVGAGGYGQAILTGIRLDSTATILEGAIPAAALSLLVQALFRLVERRLSKRGGSPEGAR